jgi:hypothetical protein
MIDRIGISATFRASAWQSLMAEGTNALRKTSALSSLFALSLGAEPLTREMCPPSSQGTSCSRGNRSRASQPTCGRGSSRSPLTKEVVLERPSALSLPHPSRLDSSPGKKTKSTGAYGALSSRGRSRDIGHWLDQTGCGSGTGSDCGCRGWVWMVWSVWRTRSGSRWMKFVWSGSSRR